MSRQSLVAKWVETRLGMSALVDTTERGTRNLEESLELAQACGVPQGIAQRLLEHVYSKPAGYVEQEIGGVGTTLLALAESVGMDAMACIDKETERIYTLPPERFQKRQQLNVKLGIGAKP